MYKLLLVLPALVFFVVTSVEANVIVRTSDQLEVAEGDIVDGELVAVGLPVILSNNVAEDATLLGNRVKVNGLIGGDLLAAGFFVDVDAAVGDDVRIVGGEISIADTIGGDLIVLGGTVDILSTAAVSGDVVVYGGTVHVAGSVGGDIVGVMENLQVNGSVGGGIDVYVTNFSLGEQASVTAAIEYTSYNLLTQSLNATVAGDIVRSDPLLLQESGWPRMTLMIFLVGLFSSLLWYLVSRKSLTAVTNQGLAHLLRSAFIGCLAPVLVLLVVVVLFISQLGMYVSFVLLFGLLTALLLAGAAVPSVVGQLILRPLPYQTTDGPLPIVLGVLILTICALVPVVGGYLLVAAYVITLGGLLEALVQANRH